MKQEILISLNGQPLTDLDEQYAQTALTGDTEALNRVARLRYLEQKGKFESLTRGVVFTDKGRERIQS